MGKIRQRKMEGWATRWERLLGKERKNANSRKGRRTQKKEGLPNRSEKSRVDQNQKGSVAKGCTNRLVAQRLSYKKVILPKN